MKTQDRITKQELMKLYGVDRTTIETWITRYNLPMIEISSIRRRNDLPLNRVGHSCFARLVERLFLLNRYWA